MKAKTAANDISGFCKILTTILIFLIALMFLQGIIIETARILTINRQRLEHVRQDQKRREKELTAEEEKIIRTCRSEKKFLPDGAIHLVYHPEKPGRFDSPRLYIYDTNDNLLWQGPPDEQPYDYLCWYDPHRRGRYHSHEYLTHYRMRQLQLTEAMFSRAIEIPVASVDGGSYLWRYSRRRQIFTGYAGGGKVIGYLGRSGFTTSAKQAKPFGDFQRCTGWCRQDSTDAILLWQSTQRISEINLSKQTVQPLFEDPGSGIAHVRLNLWRFPLSEETKTKIRYRPMIHCRTKDGRHHLVLKDPDQKLTVTVGDDWSSDLVKIVASTEKIYVLRRERKSSQEPAAPDPGKSEIRQIKDLMAVRQAESVELYTLEDDGKLHRLSRFEWDLPIHYRSPERRRRPAYWDITTGLSPPFYTPLANWQRRTSLPTRHDIDDAVTVASQLIFLSRPGGRSANYFFCLISAAVVLWHGWSRRTTMARLIAWVIFAGVFNVAALATYLALNHTPTVKCAACGRKRGLQTPNCPRCSTPPPVPQRRETDLLPQAGSCT